METKFSPEYFISLRGIIKLTQVIVGIVILVLTLVPLTSESVLANGGWRMRYLGALTVSFLMSDIALLYGNLFVFVIKQIIERTYSAIGAVLFIIALAFSIWFVAEMASEGVGIIVALIIFVAAQAILHSVNVFMPRIEFENNDTIYEIEGGLAVDKQDYGQV